MFHILALSFLKYDLARANSKVHQVALAFVVAFEVKFEWHVITNLVSKTIKQCASL